MDLSGLSPELREKAKECKTMDEVLALAQEQGEDLSESELKAIAGGSWGCDEDCYGLNIDRMA